jgi:iron complex transport system permease protein
VIIQVHMQKTVSPLRRQRFNQWAVLSVLLMLALLSIFIACAIGSVDLTLSDLVHALLPHADTTNIGMATTVIDLRLHRALSAFVTGATLSLAGVLMQALLRNPLADPYILGVSGGASVGALAALMLFAASWIVDAAAFGGALAISVLLYLLARRDLRGVMGAEGSAPLLLLTGVVLARYAVSLAAVGGAGWRAGVFMPRGTRHECPCLACGERGDAGRRRGQLASPPVLLFCATNGERR